MNSDQVEIGLAPDAGGALCIGVRVLSRDATVQDYLDAFNRFQAEKVAPCDGCTNCCWERAPLTAPDVIQFANAPDGFGHFPTDNPTQEERLLLLIRDFVYILRSNKSEALADFCLKRDEEGHCIFLDPNRQRCLIHSLRPLVCQTYVCLPSQPAAAALRGQIVNEGENELARLLGEGIQALPDILPGFPAHTAAKWRNYRSRGFTGKKDFADVLIREVVRETLWDKLFTPDPLDNVRNPRKCRRNPCRTRYRSGRSSPLWRP